MEQMLSTGRTFPRAYCDLDHGIRVPMALSAFGCIGVVLQDQKAAIAG